MFKINPRFIVITFIIFLSIIYLQVCLLSIMTQSLPNQLDFTIVDNFGLFIDLFQINPATAVSIFLNKPVIIIERFNIAQLSQIWGLYLLPVNIITLLALSIFLAKIKLLKPSASIINWVFIASATLIVSVFYLRIQACCTSEPGWLLEVWLLSRIYSPLYSAAYWQQVFTVLDQWFLLIQAVLYILALVILVLSYKHSKNNLNAK